MNKDITPQNNFQVAPQANGGDFMESIAVLARRANYVVDLKKQIMQPNRHYGVIPGCGDKPTLLKNGAELLCMAFKLASDAHVEIHELQDGHREYTVTTKLSSMSTGELVATGLGSCSTMESKYRYRGNEAVNTGKPVPKNYWDAKKNNDSQQMKSILGGAGFVAKKDESGNWMIFKKSEKKMENPDIADVYNTVLKMASKRSLIDATLKATGGSCEFTQDLEDMVPNAQSFNNSDKQNTINQTPANNTPINDEQDKINFEKAMNYFKVKNPQHFDNALKITGFNSIDDIPSDKRQETYDIVCTAFSTK